MMKIIFWWQLRVVRTQATLFLKCMSEKVASDIERLWNLILRSTQNRFKNDIIKIQSRSLSDPTISDIDFENKMAWTTLYHLVTGHHRDFLLVTFLGCWCHWDSRILLTNKMRQNQQLKIVVQHLASVMLVTTLYWWLYSNDRFTMLVTESICW